MPSLDAASASIDRIDSAQATRYAVSWQPLASDL